MAEYCNRLAKTWLDRKGAVTRGRDRLVARVQTVHVGGVVDDSGMGKNNRLRRAAKQRKRQRAEPRRAPDAGPSLPPDPDKVAADALSHARWEHHRGVPVGECVRPLLALPDGPIDRAVDAIFAGLLRGLFAGGWAPIDLYEVSRRRADAVGSSYLIDAVAAVTAEYPDQLVDPRWLAQLDQIDGRPWWDRRRPQLGQWAARHGLACYDALTMVIELLGVCDALPRIEEVLPPPGAAPRVGSVGTIDEAQERILAKVRALLAKAESTDFDGEAEALSAKAQELMSRYALDRAMLDHGRGARQQATLCRIWLDNPYVTAKAMLVDAVASANRCRTVLDNRFGSMTVVGDHGDLRVVELLATSLLLQGARAMLSVGSQQTHRGVSRTRSYRQAFLVAYASRIGERLRAANEATVSAIDDSRLLPVLSSRSRAVDELMEETFPRLVAKRVSVSNAAGWGAGTAAADLALLEVHEALSDTAEGRRSEAAS
jgi:hypothetical protein